MCRSNMRDLDRIGGAGRGVELWRSDRRRYFRCCGRVAAGYGTLYVLVGTFHLIGCSAILLFAGKIQPFRAVTS